MSKGDKKSKSRLSKYMESLEDEEDDVDDEDTSAVDISTPFLKNQNLIGEVLILKVQ